MRGIRLPAAAAAMALLAAGCGSSTAYRQASDKGGGAVDGGALGEVGVGEGTPSVDTVPGQAPGGHPAAGTNATTGATAPGGSRPGAPGAPGGPGNPTGGGPGGGTGPANTTPIRLGYVIADNGEVEALTGRKVNSANAEREIKALIDWANGTGGVAGRRIEAKQYVVSQTSNDAQRTAACVGMTEDDKREVVIDATVFVTEASYACFAKHRTTFVGTVTTSSSAYLRSTAPYIMTTHAGLDREMRALPQALKAAGYFDGASVGVILDDIPNLRAAYEQAFLPAMQQAGVPVSGARFVGYEGTASEQAQMGNAVLEFKTRNIQRVLMFVYSLNYLSFTSQAESQSYYPRYAYSDYMSLQAVAAGFGSPNQNRDAVAITTVDGLVADDNTRRFGNTGPLDRSKLSPGRQRCLDIYTQQTGTNYYNPSESRPSTSHLIYCDNFFLWLDTARSVGASWTPAAGGNALRAMGARFQSPVQKTTDFGSGRFDGAGSYRIGRLDSSCNCYVKVLDWAPLP